ncbi:MAG: hypothetical protein M0011_00740 [Elusimicrobia bacterium]|nr:hypothetical protein [Elusimicrobiota bacterium]
MKNKGMSLLLAGLLLGAALPVLAQSKSPDEKKLDRSSAMLDEDAAKPEGEKAVAARLTEEFKVDAARVQGLRDQKLGYGEVGIVLSLAQKLEGGITDANVQKIMDMRKGPPVMGWGEIAKKLGLKLGPVVSQVKKVSAAAHREAAAGMKKEGKGEKKEGMKPERHEHMERSNMPADRPAHGRK